MRRKLHGCVNITNQEVRTHLANMKKDSLVCVNVTKLENYEIKLHGCVNITNQEVKNHACSQYEEIFPSLCQYNQTRE